MGEGGNFRGFKQSATESVVALVIALKSESNGLSPDWGGTALRSRGGTLSSLTVTSISFRGEGGNNTPSR